ncbi:MAG: SusC/RagA family TonB-linked outer membrane protein [Flavobacteriaceae bacterium]
MKKLNAFLLMLCLLGTVSLVAQQTISGKVTDVSGEPIPGASVLVQGTTNGVAADFDGNFTIRAFQGEVLVFSSIAFVSKKVIISKGASYNVSLEEDAQMLQEVVVIGYGSSTKKDLVSSVASIKSDVLENQPVARLDQALQGRAAGVEVTANNGSPGSGSTIRIRGNSSINGNNNPLYVVDGFIAGTDFNLNTININDIKSVEILKDATALSIYGTRGASGVILITTKNGTEMAPGKPKFTINHYSSLQETANQVEVLGGQDYVDYINESGQFVAGASGFGETDTSLSLTYVGEIETTDWLDLVSQTGFISNTDVSVSGNSESSNYYVSLNYFDQKGIVRGSGLERVNFRTNLDVKVSDKFKMGVRFNASNYRIENNKVNYSGIVSSVLPIRTIYDDDGNFTGTNPISSSAQRNPEADIQLRVDHDIVTKLISNAYLEYELFKNFKLKSTFGAELTYIKENNYLPGILPEIVTGGFGRINTNHARSFLNENTFTYDVGIKDHYLKFLGGFTWQKNNSESIRTEADGFPNDATSFNNLESGNPDTFFVDSAFSQRTLASFLGRVNYSYNSKYLLTLVGRYDGSSVFETGNKYAFFPSVGVAWNVDEESFLKESNTIDQLKLRASYGIVGEQGVDPYNSISRYNNTTTSFNETIFNGIQVGDVSSDGLVWETTKQLDLGLEVGFLNNRVSLEADYYKKTTEDLLLAKALSAQAGGGTQLQNVGSVQNSGVELALNTINVEHKNFR